MPGKYTPSEVVNLKNVIFQYFIELVSFVDRLNNVKSRNEETFESASFKFFRSDKVFLRCQKSVIYKKFHMKSGGRIREGKILFEFILSDFTLCSKMPSTQVFLNQRRRNWIRLDNVITYCTVHRNQQLHNVLVSLRKCTYTLVIRVLHRGSRAQLPLSAGVRQEISAWWIERGGCKEK